MGMIARQQWEKEQRRTHILRAAEQVFGNKNASVVTMDDIAHAANLGKGTLYLYFASKDELYLEIANRFVSEMLESLEHAAPESSQGHQRVARLLQQASEFALANRDRFRVAMTWMSSGAGAASSSQRLAEYRRLFGSLFGELADAVDAGKRDGSVSANLDTPTLVTELLGALFGTLIVELNAATISQSIPTIAHLEGLSRAVVRLLLSALACQGTMTAIEPTQPGESPANATHAPVDEHPHAAE